MTDLERAVREETRSIVERIHDYSADEPAGTSDVRNLLRHPFPRVVDVTPNRIGPSVGIDWLGQRLLVAPDHNDGSGEYLERIVVWERTEDGRERRIGELDHDVYATELEWLPEGVSVEHVLLMLGMFYASVNRLLSRVDEGWVEAVEQAASDVWPSDGDESEDGE